MFGKDLWNLGQFTLNQVEQTYSTMAGFCPKIHISSESDEFFSKTQRVEKTFINIDRTMILGNATVHCRISYYPDTKRHFDRLVIFDDQIKAYYYGNDHPEIIKLPQTSQEFGTFVASGGRIDVDDYPEKKFLDCKIGHCRSYYMARIFRRKWL